MAHKNLEPARCKFFNQKEAAAYCRYSVETFRGYVTKYNIPRRGPDNRKFCVDDLDRFMTDPFCFSGQNATTYKRTPKVVTA